MYLPIADASLQREQVLKQFLIVNVRHNVVDMVRGIHQRVIESCLRMQNDCVHAAILLELPPIMCVFKSDTAMCS